MLGYDHILCHIDQPPCQITGIGCFKRGIRKTFASPMGGNKVLNHGESFQEVCSDRVFNNFTRLAGQCFLRLGHQTAHPGQLPYLLLTTTRTGIGHHIQGIKTILITA